MMIFLFFLLILLIIIVITIQSNDNHYNDYDIDIVIDNDDHKYVGPFIRIDGALSYINLREIQVFNNGIQLSGLHAVMSRTFNDNSTYNAMKCIDNDTNDFYDDGSYGLCHSSSENSWLLIDLNGQAIDKIIVYNRRDCCGDRISGANIKITNDYNGNNITWQSIFPYVNYHEYLFHICPNGQYDNGNGCEILDIGYLYSKGMLPLLQLDSLNTDQSHTLSHITIGKSITKDYNGNYYYFFVNSPQTDAYVSKAMLSSEMWEPCLNQLFRYLWISEGVLLNLPVIDVGVNFGSFLLYAASLGCRLYGFEMQPYLHTLVDMSLRINGYRGHVSLFNTAVWDENDIELSYTPYPTNYGATVARQDSSGQFKIMSKRIDELFTEEKIFFMKIDIEGMETHALEGMDKYISNRKVKHIAIEIIHPNYSNNSKLILDNLYNIGYICRIYDEPNDCIWPNLNTICTMNNYNDVVQLFANRFADKGYFNFHCYLPDSLFN